jgi:hypothetical protein
MDQCLDLEERMLNVLVSSDVQAFHVIAKEVRSFELQLAIVLHCISTELSLGRSESLHVVVLE